MSKIRIRKEVRDLLRETQDRGWRFDGYTGSCHVKIRHVSGRFVIISNTPSDYRSALNLQREMRRIEREAGTQ